LTSAGRRGILLAVETMPKKPDTRQRVSDMTAAGMTPRQIALALSISTQAVYLHLKKLREEDEASA